MQKSLTVLSKCIIISIIISMLNPPPVSASCVFGLQEILKGYDLDDKLDAGLSLYIKRKLKSFSGDKAALYLSRIRASRFLNHDFRFINSPKIMPIGMDHPLSRLIFVHYLGHVQHELTFQGRFGRVYRTDAVDKGEREAFGELYDFVREVYLSSDLSDLKSELTKTGTNGGPDSQLNFLFIKEVEDIFLLSRDTYIEKRLAAYSEKAADQKDHVMFFYVGALSAAIAAGFSLMRLLDLLH